jgi:hypothetical protein
MQYIQVLTQWLMLFALVGIIFIPAMIFRKIAFTNNKNGWLFFFGGMGVGSISLIIARSIFYWLIQFDIVAKTENAVVAMMFFIVFPAMIATIGVILFKRAMLSNH